MGWRETVEWISNNGPVREYGPQAQYQDHSLRKHNGPATPGHIKMQFEMAGESYSLEFDVADHDITNDQFGNIQYIQLLHLDGHVQIVRASSFIVEFWAH